jgi:hypothetical protein
MSIVPRDVVDSWYGKCDSSEQEYYIANRAAQWALDIVSEPLNRTYIEQLRALLPEGEG